MKRFSRVTLLVLLLGVAGMTKGYAFSFSAVCPSGQTLYYNIIDATNHYVSITCPGTVGTNGWNNYTKPAGQVTLPNIVEYDNNTYIVTRINQYAFYGCTDISVINIPENVTYIGPYAFWNCPNLSMLYFDATHCTQMYTKVNSTTYSVFNRSTSTSDGPSMNYIILGDNVTNIPNYAFRKSTNIDHLIIPETVTNIGMYAFYGCNNLSYIQSLASTPPTLGTSAFYGIPVSVNIILPCNATGAYTAAAGWNNYGVYYGYYYEEFPYWVEVSSNNASLGSATITQEPDCENNGQAVVTATPYSGYVFVNWTKDGNIVSTDANYSFTVTDNVKLVANFLETPITITTIVDPSNSGVVSGDGIYEQGTTCTLTATANAGYTFAHWIENGDVVSSDSTYSFDVIDDRTLVAQFQVNSYTVTMSALPVEAGTVSGGGTYAHGESCTLTATPATGYIFANWTKNGVEVSIDSIYTFSVTETATYVAHFSLPYTISVSTSVSDYGTVSGGGVFPYGRICSVTATANIGYEFENWTEDGIIVSQTANYSFTVTGDRNLVANFSTGQLNGVFSVGQNSLVGFSKGNLKYQASTNTWRFASKQYDYVGSGNANIASNYTGWIDLFGWGTSGYNHGAVCYQPWSTSQTDSDYYAYGAYDYNLYDQTGKADWGYNAIINGGNTTNTWRTLTKDEWEYVFNMRNTESGIRYVRACVNNVNGVILLPDDWDATYFTFNNINGQGYEAYSGNVISASQWSGLEQYGAVFLPAAGWRYGTPTPKGVGSFGIYWSASYDSNALSFDGEVWWEGNAVNTASYLRSDGCSVRLVTTVQHASFNINTSSNPANVGAVTGDGCYAAGQYCTLTATPVMGYVFVNWTENGEEVSTSNTLSFTVTEDRSLVANFAEVGSEGMLNGVFSTGHNSIVSFSQGNLQYQASTNTWRFAEHQWDYVGENNANISSTNDGWIDLFGWGTGNNPTNTSTSNNDYVSFIDWGYNRISNGGNTTNSKRTLSKDEWEYVFNTRVTASGIRYARANVNNTNGIILLPDDWDSSYYALNNTNYAYASFHSNTITETQWDVLEQHGAVFLPASGYRDETSIHSVDSTGSYWSSSYNNDYWAYSLYFYVDNSNYSYTTAAYDYGYRYRGSSVRLVCPVVTSSYSINATPSPTTGGTISGNDMYAYGQYCTLTAIPDVGYAFVNWTENGNVVSTTAVYTFIVNEDRNLVANFTYIGTTGMLAGEFSVDNNSLVCFSQGNLQYQASTGTWRFAPYQYTCIGNNNRYISQTYSGWIDLFGWGTSGWDCGNTYYHPWDSDGINGSIQTLYGPPGAYDLTDDYALSDWGVYNAISNGANVAGYWRTLTRAEWDYLFNRRRASRVNGVYSARYAKAKVANVYGVILFPDNYTHPSDVAQPVGINSTGNTGWSGNNYNATAWNKMQAAGAVFLPAAGSRSATTVSTGWGWYWSATSRNNNGYANCVKFDEDNMITYESSHRCVGFSVRLVRSVHQTSSYDINITPNPTEGGMLTGAGTYSYLQPCTLTAVPNEGYTFVNWTESGNVVSTDASYSFTVTGNRALSANFEYITPTYNISVSANPLEGGTITGGGTYMQGATCNLTATPASGYSFVNWTEDGVEVSTESTYSFEVTGPRTLVANFEEITNYWMPIGGTQYQMGVYGVILIDGVEQTSDMLEVGAFCGEECRGSQFAMDFGDGHYVAPLDIVSNSASGESITFRLYDHELNQERTDLTCSSTVTFQDQLYLPELDNPWYQFTFSGEVFVSANVNPVAAGEVTGTGMYGLGTTATLTATANSGYIFANWTLNDSVVSTESVYSFTVVGAVNLVANFLSQQICEMNTGWNWWSTYIDVSGAEGLTMLEEGLGNYGQTISAGPRGSVRRFAIGWRGSLNTLEPEYSYKVQVSEPCSFSMIGSIAQAESHPITIVPNWNWIGYPVTSTQSVASALSDFTPANNDIITGQNGSARYFANSNKWFPESFSLVPGKGYLYKSNATENKTLVYHNGRTNETESTTKDELVWKNDPYAYPDNAILTVTVCFDGEEQRNGNLEVGVFVNGECRGSANLNYFEPLDRYYAVLTAKGQDGDLLEFGLVDKVIGEVSMQCANHVVFENNLIAGDLDNPFVLHFKGTEAQDRNMLVYPNPINRNCTFSLVLPTGESVEKLCVIDAMGRIVMQKSGCVQTSEVSGPAVAGIYTIKVVCKSGDIYYGKLIVE